MIVIKDMVIDTYPAYDEGTLKATCIFGQPDPRRESGSPRLMNTRYITAKSNDPIGYIPINRTFRPIANILTQNRPDINSDQMVEIKYDEQINKRVCLIIIVLTSSRIMLE